MEQWKNQLLDAVDLLPLVPAESNTHGSTGAKRVQELGGGAAGVGSQRVACVTGKAKERITPDGTDVVITTYAMVAAAHRYSRRHAAQAAARIEAAASSNAAAAVVAAGTSNQSSTLATARGGRGGAGRVDPRMALFQPYGLVILDEVHVVPAEFFRQSLAFIDAKAAIGLTATYVREDSKILDLFHIVGPKLYDLSWDTLCKQGYLAHVTCTEVHTALSGPFACEYISRATLLHPTGNTQVAGSSVTVGINGAMNKKKAKKNAVPLLTLLAAANPNKMLCVQELIRRHTEDSGKILVFCDHLILLREYAAFLGCPFVYIETSHKDRLRLFSDFQSTTTLNCICVSRVGDVSVNLPAANVVIQVSSHGASRRQEAQRLGRILRPKERSCDGRRAEAYFYSIVSDDTHEVVYADKRSQYLLDLGYACRCLVFRGAANSDDDTNSIGGSPQWVPRGQQLPAPAQAPEQLGAERNASLGDLPAETDVKAVSASRSPPRALGTTGAVGDVRQVKREQLFDFQAHSRVLRLSCGPPSSPRQVSAHGLLAPTMEARRAWTIGFLAKVVASWELLFAEELRAAARNNYNKRERDGAGDGGEVEDRGEERRRAAQELKTEMHLGAATALRAADMAQAGDLGDLTRLDVDVAYHEY